MEVGVASVGEALQMMLGIAPVYIERFVYFFIFVYFHKQVGLAAASVGEAVQKVHSIAPIEQPAAQSGGMYLGHKTERPHRSKGQVKQCII